MERGRARSQAPLKEASPVVVDPSAYRFSPEEDTFLEEVERACFRYFWEQTHPDTGLTKDRSRAGGADYLVLGNIAATGFGPTALFVGHSQVKWDVKAIRIRLRTLCSIVPAC